MKQPDPVPDKKAVTMGDRVVVGMSGGVDSSVAALLLKQQGYDVIGVTMQVWDAGSSLQMEREGGCCGQSAVDDARRVCEKIGIPYYVMGFRDVFEKKVIDYFVDTYISGQTPNPCIICNRDVKWSAMLRAADEIGAPYVATGHYARIEKLPNGRFSVRNSVTARKDQTYALCRLTQEELSRTLMPVGDYHKSEVREIAAKAGLAVAKKPDSEEVCFVTDDDYAGYLDRNAAGRVPAPGRFVTKDGTDLGPNRGITHYTIGQRKHLGLALGHPVFVTDIDPKTGNVTVGEEKDVFGTVLGCRDLNFMAVEDMKIGQKLELAGKIRYNGPVTPCTVEKTGEDTLTAVFHEPVRAITPGQAAVFYDGNHIFAAGTIQRREK